MEICSDVNHSCCDTAMDSMANDFRGNNHINLNTVSASIKSKLLSMRSGGTVEEWSPKDIGECAEKKLYKVGEIYFSIKNLLKSINTHFIRFTKGPV